MLRRLALDTSDALDAIDPLSVGFALDEIGVAVLDLFGALDTTAATGAATRAPWRMHRGRE